MLATLRTIMWSIDSASTNAARSAAMRSTAWRAVRGGFGVAPVPELGDRAAGAEMRAGADPRGGRGQLVAARGDPVGLEDARVAPEFLGRFRERSLRGCRGRRSRNRRARAAASRRNSGSSVTSPVRSASPRAIAASPSVIVVPTPPNAPTNQRPTR